MSCIDRLALAFSVFVLSASPSGAEPPASPAAGTNPLGAPSQADAFSFAPSRDYETASPTTSVVIGHLNEDRYPDLVAVDNAAAKVSILLGNGDGTFGSRRDFATAGSPWEAAAADLNGDGHLDVAVAKSGSAGVSVLLGNGDGTFRPKIEYPIGSGSGSVAVGDLNSDAWPDLALATASGTTMIVLLGVGGGAFGPPITIGVGIQPTSVAIVDLNGDGMLDVATADGGRVVLGWSVSVRLGNGDGTFGPRSEYASHPWPISIAAGDLDGDDRVDLVATSEGTGQVTILINNGDGSFRKTNLVAGTDLGGLAIADLNQDGRQDLAVAGRADQNGILVLLGNGDGTFGPANTVPTGAAPFATAAGDLNGDGWPDLVSANAGANTISVLLNASNPVGVETSPIWEHVELSPAFPNPVRGRATIHFATPTQGGVDLRIYDAAGHHVRTLVNGTMQAGAHSLAWDLRADNGARVPTGIYLCELRVPGTRLARRIAVLD